MENNFDPGMIQEEFGEREYFFYKKYPYTVSVWYDAPPMSAWLHRALTEGVIRIVLDYDRVGWSKTGYIYRISGNKTIDPFDPKKKDSARPLFKRLLGL